MPQRPLQWGPTTTQLPAALGTEPSHKAAGHPAPSSGLQMAFTRQACFLASCWYPRDSAFFRNSLEEFDRSSSSQSQLGIQRLEPPDRRLAELTRHQTYVRWPPFISVGYFVARELQVLISRPDGTVNNRPPFPLETRQARTLAQLPLGFVYWFLELHQISRFLVLS